MQACTDTAKLAYKRLAGVEVPVFEDNESTFPELQARIEKTLAILEAVDLSSLPVGKENEELIMETKVGNFRFTHKSFVSEYAIPNFHFHLGTAYCLLRVQGVLFGSFDYLKDVFVKV